MEWLTQSALFWREALSSLLHERGQAMLTDKVRWLVCEEFCVVSVFVRCLSTCVRMREGPLVYSIQPHTLLHFPPFPTHMNEQGVALLVRRLEECDPSDPDTEVWCQLRKARVSNLHDAWMA